MPSQSKDIPVDFPLPQKHGEHGARDVLNGELGLANI